MADARTSKWIAVARLLRPQGRRGELLADPLTDLPGIFEPGRSLWLGSSESAQPPAGQSPVTVEAQWSPAGRNAGRIVLKLASRASITEAEQLKGQFLLLPAEELPPLEEDTFLVADLLGCTLVNGQFEVGLIVDVQFAMAADGRTRLPDAAPLLAVESAGNTPPEGDPQAEVANELLLIPFVRAWLDSVDLVGKRIVMHLPDGLTERG